MKGVAFSPVALAKKTGIPTENANEPGDPGKLGRFRGKPIPYGYGEWIFSSDMDAPYGPVLEQAVQALEHNLAIVREYGAEEIVLHLFVQTHEQCNLEFSSSDLQRISSLGIPLAISCEMSE